MKLAVLVLSIITVISGTAFAQGITFPHLSANYKNISLEKIIEVIEKKRNIKFSYLDQLVKNKRITAFFKNKPFPEALQDILQGTNLSFRIVDSTNIILFKKEVQKVFSIQGRVIEKETREAISFANVVIPSMGTGDATDENGYYKIDLPLDTYEIRFLVIGYKPFSKKIVFNKNTVLNAELETQAIELAAVEITPGIIQISSEEPSIHLLGSEEILSSPNFSKDVFRSIQILPGVAATDFSAKPYIRGGHHDETAILLDNMEIYEPFHLEEVSDGVASIINAEYVKNLKLATGGFSAKYPDKMSGVMEINTLNKPRDYLLRFSIDRLISELVLNKKISRKMNYFLSTRRSNFDIFPGAFSNTLNFDRGTQNLIRQRYGAFNEVSPLFYDLWNKLVYQFNAKHKLSFNFLFSYDELFYVRGISLFRTEFAETSRKNFYGWINWNWLINNRMYSVTTLGYQDLSKRGEFTFDLNPQDGNAERSNNGIFILKQKNIWEIHEKHSLEYGIEFKKFRSDYFFDDIRLNRFQTTEDTTVIDTFFVDSKLNGTTFSGYLQNTWRASNKLFFLTGLRFSNQSYTKKPQIAPRLASKYQLTDNLDLKLAYGWYFQPENFERLKTYLGKTQLEDEPGKSIHYFGSINYAKGGLQFNLDAYFKDYLRLNEDFDFDLYNRSSEGIPDFPFNTVKGTSKGFDAFIRANYASNNLISAAYSYGKNRITNNSGLTTARTLDRTHTISLNKVVKLKNGITLGGLWRYHTGDPFTPTTVKVLGDSTVFESLAYFETEGKNTARLPTYHALDLKFEKMWQFKKASIIAYISILNVFNRRNIRRFHNDVFFADNRLVRFIEIEETFFDRAYVPGVSIIF